MRKKLLDNIQKNYGWITACLSGLVLVLTFSIKFLEYYLAKIYFDYYKISFDFFDFKGDKIIYDFCFSILFLLLFYVASDSRRKFKIFKIKNKDTLNIIFYIISNIVLIIYFYVKIKLNSIEIIVCIFYLIFMEKLFIFLMSKDFKEEKLNINLVDVILNTLKILIFILASFIILLGFSEKNKLKNLKEYRIMDKNKVLLYTTNDYYVLLNCRIENNVLYIRRGEEVKISNDNIVTKLMKFEKVIIEN